ncbi:hypothetical protein PAESOLCIP111_04699 [Paenibacillus solanacearum]|uniref:BIG2 domain-containing protein n=1 Tax=Paenibacillus solanacearum TaxID=2048548 RepID=A0A916K645_9BACL|nr:glycoside hydrolase family 44 protein [Paenibacillus solanacearum]CAG7644427.1 hypothetical protein PAESOLCIP111_04699 [Paenibacillus solanacearum]
MAWSQRAVRASLRSAAAFALSALLACTSVFPSGFAAKARAEDSSAKLVVYDDQLRNGFQDYSWAAVNTRQTKITHSGPYAIQMNPSNHGGLYLYKDRVVQVSDYGMLEFWVHGGSEGGQQLRLVLNAGGQQVAEMSLNQMLPQGKPAASSWQKATLNLTALNLPYGMFDGILLQDSSGTEQPAIYFDDISLIKDQQVRVSSLSVMPESVTMNQGDSSSLQAEARYSDGDLRGVNAYAQWSSSNPQAVTVEPGGALRAVGAGASVVSATYQGFSDTVSVTVRSADPGPQQPPGQEPLPEVKGIVVYDDKLQSPFQDYSWAQHDVAHGGTVHTGAKAIQMDPSGEGGLYLYKGDGAVLVKDHDRLEFWIHGGAQGGQQLNLSFNSGGVSVATVSVSDITYGGAIPAGAWARAYVSLPELNLPGGIFDGILIRGATAGSQPPVYIDDVHLLEKYIAPPTLLELLLDKYESILLPGDKGALELTANYSDSTSKAVQAEAKWTTSDPGIATVERGVVTAQQQGIAKVTAELGGKHVSAYVQVTGVTPVRVYDEGPAAEFSDWSWGTRDMHSTKQAHQGKQSISFRARGYEGIWLHNNNRPYELSELYGVQLWLHGGTSGKQKLKLLLLSDRSVVGDYDLAPLLPAEGLPAGAWTQVTVKLADIGISSETFDGVGLQAWGEQDQGEIFIDDIALLRNTNPVPLPEPELPKVAVQVDMNSARRAVSQEIFGVNFEEMPAENASQMKFPIKRWGGNQMTRYNWELDVTNRGGDWYFLNLTNGTPDPSQLPNGSLSDRFIAQSIADQTKVLLQMPTIGWTPKSRDVSWSFSIEKYGAQAGNECDWGEAWCRKDAGNGKLKSGEYVTGNDPEDTSKRVGPEFIGRWVDHLKSRFGSAVRYYALDNEPALWGHAHWDVHPEMTTYDEIWKYTQDYAKVIKAKDPQAQIFGPVSWGWCEYFYSGKDGCYPGDDMRAHGDKPFLEWYLQQVSDYERKTGQRLVDVLDIHYYPAEGGIAFSNDESTETYKRRMKSLKSLYDPTFQDPSSWIQEPVRLIPRMRELIDQNAPGMRLAITEYNFGDGGGIGSGLAQAEALALFAREGVDVATRWGGLPANTPLEDAFKLYVNYDGKGSRIEGDMVQTVSSNLDAVGAYTVQAAGGTVYTLLFNKDAAPRVAEIASNGDLSGSHELYRFDGRQRLKFEQHVQGTQNGLSVKLPPRSATLIVSKR